MLKCHCACVRLCDRCATVHVALFEPMSKRHRLPLLTLSCASSVTVCCMCECAACASVLHVRVCCEGRLCFWSGFGVENTMLFKFVHANAVVLPLESPPAKIIWCTHAHFNPLTHIPCTINCHLSMHCISAMGSASPPNHGGP